MTQTITSDLLRPTAARPNLEIGPYTADSYTYQRRKTRVVMVGTGDTLWDIAADLADDGDVRGMVDHIERLNALDTGMVVAGQRLRVPVTQ